jgi:hypothetical protein
MKDYRNADAANDLSDFMGHPAAAARGLELRLLFLF